MVMENSSKDTSKSNSYLKKMNEYMTPRQEGEINLIYEVRSILVRNGVTTISVYDNDKNIIDSINLNPKAQVFNLNRFWLFQLLSVNDSTVDARYCLINTEPKDWLKLFEKVIMPVILHYNLPVNLL